MLAWHWGRTDVWGSVGRPVSELVCNLGQAWSCTHSGQHGCCTSLTRAPEAGLVLKGAPRLRLWVSYCTQEAEVTEACLKTEEQAQSSLMTRDIGVDLALGELSTKSAS
jgi:hypothetical protein